MGKEGTLFMVSAPDGADLPSGARALSYRTLPAAHPVCQRASLSAQRVRHGVGAAYHYGASPPVSSSVNGGST